MAPITRRSFLQSAAATGSALALFQGGYRVSKAEEGLGDTVRSERFRLKYVLASPMYGTAPLAEVLAEAKKVGAGHIDIWPRSHANHREQVEEMGHERFLELLGEHNVNLGMITRYDLGPLRLHEEIPVLKKLGGRIVVCGAGRGAGDTPRQRMKDFVTKMQPQVALAEENGVLIGIENHAKSLIYTADDIRYFAEFATSPNLGLAMAPYHLPQDPGLIAGLIEDLGSSLVHFQAWQHGEGCMKKLPKEEELLQLPGRGPLDFAPILAALARIGYAGWTEIFMHPVPRGIPILETTAKVTDEINRARKYLEESLAKGAGPK